MIEQNKSFCFDQFFLEMRLTSKSGEHPVNVLTIKTARSKKYSFLCDILIFALQRYRCIHP